MNEKNQPLQNLPKHQKYKSSYKTNEVYWGLGIEHETYLETSKLKQISLKELKENQKAERYCVDYLTVYTRDQFHNALDGLFEEDKPILIPILANSHSFQKTDLNGEHMTTYTRIPKPNPNYNGQTIFEWLCKQNPDIFVEEYDKSYLFDGDTIEFMTQNFYKTTVYEVMHELKAIEKQFIKGLNCLPREGLLKTYAPFKIMDKNYPFASYLTNLKNNAMFNNGTIHINITLPTKLDKEGKIADFNKFKEDHRKLAKALQWISPLMVAKYGAYDPLCESSNGGEKYAAGSQRLAVSRYIGLGSFDTDEMPVGKILTVPVKSLKNIDWYYEFHKKADYKFLDEIGLDINFNKHYSHGLEFRILESLDYEDINKILDTTIYLADFCMEVELINPKLSKLWHKLAEKCVLDGKGYKVDVYDQNELFKIFNVPYDAKEPQLAADIYDLITEELYNKYKDARYARCMIKGFDYEEQKSVEPYDPMADFIDDNSIVNPNEIQLINKLSIQTPELSIQTEESLSTFKDNGFTINNVSIVELPPILTIPVSTSLETRKNFLEMIPEIPTSQSVESELDKISEVPEVVETPEISIDVTPEKTPEKTESVEKTENVHTPEKIVEVVKLKRKWLCC
jgi:hypothetical protein